MAFELYILWRSCGPTSPLFWPCSCPQLETGASLPIITLTFSTFNKVLVKLVCSLLWPTFSYGVCPIWGKGATKIGSGILLLVPQPFVCCVLECFEASVSLLSSKLGCCRWSRGNIIVTPLLSSESLYNGDDMVLSGTLGVAGVELGSNTAASHSSTWCQEGQYDYEVYLANRTSHYHLSSG